MRLTRNPWLADVYLTDTFNDFIEGHESMVKTIVNSPDIKSMFQQRVQLMSTSDDLVAGRIRDLSSAKQRFASTQKPLGRFILFFDAVVATAFELQTKRAGTEMGKRGTWFLQSIDEERLLTLAMLADAGDEASAVVRFFDTKDHDISEAPIVLSDFLSRIDVLFLRRGCLSAVGSHHTYTSYTLDMLQESRPLRVQDGRRTIMRSLGGPSAVPLELISRCLSRMAAWVRLCMDTVRAEFPDWEVITAFGALSLKICATNQFVTDSLQRLAQTFDVDPSALKSQYVDFRRTAVVKHTQGVSNYDAWKESVRAVDASGGQTRTAHQRHALREILARYGAFLGASTSCCERTFASLVNAVGPQRSSMSGVSMTNDLKLVLLAGPHCQDNDDRIVDGAMKVWMSVLPPVRKSGKARRTRWVSGLAANGRPSTVETNFLVARRSAVSSMSVASKKRTFSEMQHAAVALSASVWTAKHDQAVSLILSEHTSLNAWYACVHVLFTDVPLFVDKVKKKLDELHTLKAAVAFEDGQLLSVEMGNSIKASVVAMNKRCAKNDWDMKLAEDRIDRRLTPVMPLVHPLGTCVPPQSCMCASAHTHTPLGRSLPTAWLARACSSKTTFVGLHLSSSSDFVSSTPVL